MTDPKIQIIKEWLDGITGMIETEADCARLIGLLDAHAAASQPADVVERVAKAIYEAKYGATRSWSSLSEEKRHDFERYAEAALSALPPRDDAERFVEFVRNLFAQNPGLDSHVARVLIARELDRLDAARKAKP